MRHIGQDAWAGAHWLMLTQGSRHIGKDAGAGARESGRGGGTCTQVEAGGSGRGSGGGTYGLGCVVARMGHVD